MQRIQQFAITLTGACGLLLVGCQPNTQTEPPAEEGAMPGQTQPVGTEEEMQEGEQPYTEEDIIREDRPDEGMAGEEPQQLSQQGQQFVDEAALSNMAEIELSKVALDKAKDQQVRDYAQRMVENHTRMGEQMKTLASQLGATVPDQMSESAKQKKDELQQLDGKAFDEKYVDIMVDDHEKAVDLFRQQSENEEDPQLQQFASRSLPMLQEHLDRAKALDEGRPYTGPQARARTKAPAKP